MSNVGLITRTRDERRHTPPFRGQSPFFFRAPQYAWRLGLGRLSECARPRPIVSGLSRSTRDSGSDRADFKETCGHFTRGAELALGSELVSQSGSGHPTSGTAVLGLERRRDASRTSSRSRPGPRSRPRLPLFRDHAPDATYRCRGPGYRSLSRPFGRAGGGDAPRPARLDGAGLPRPGPHA